ncbi:MAG: exo-alpha-sialidase, partial [Deltaproteobacteria bacterium]|nr:exo-alpha-sialidase [Deltaproteobacteria bacterium]
AINVTTSKDEGRTWSSPRRLVASPFLNLSTLVKGPPFFFQDGAIGLPVYHEFIGKFGELLRLNQAGGVLYKRRLSWGRHSLQPVIAPITDKKALGLMRYGGRSQPRLLSFKTDDGGLTWSRPVKTDLPNPNSAVAAIRSREGELLLVFNNTERKRNDLSLAISGDRGAAWRVIHSFEREAVPKEGRVPSFSYPTFLRARSGDFHLVYTWNKMKIKHVRFNRPWLEKML